MSANHDISRVVRSWIREEEHDSADHILQVVLSRLGSTPQRRPFWRARRFPNMNSPVRYAIAAAAVVVVALVGYQLLPSNTGGSGGDPTPLNTAQVSPATSPPPASAAAPGTETVRPFFLQGFCQPVEVDPDCVEDPRDETIAFTFEMPESWDLFEQAAAWIDENAPPDGASVFFYRGNWLFSDPCAADDEAVPDIRVGPTVDDFVTALVDHPSLDVTEPVDITLAGYTGRYVDLTVPDDISTCVVYKPIDGHIYAQGPGQRWHMWVLDVAGVRVLVETNDYAGTSPQRLAEIEAILDSLVITP